MFEHKGVVVIAGTVEEDELLEASLEGGAESYELVEDEDGMSALIFTSVGNLENLSQLLKDKGFALSEVELRWIPNNTVEVSEPDRARSLLKLIDTLESLDDVQNVTANFEMVDELMTVSMK